MSYFRSNWNPPENKQPKQPKEKKVKEIKPKKEKQPKPEPEPKKELTESEYIQSLIDEKDDIIDKHFQEIENIQKVINALKAKQINDIVLNERNILVSKISNKLIKMKDKTKEEKDEMYNEMIKDIKKYDKYFEIDSTKLLNYDLKY